MKAFKMMFPLDRGIDIQPAEDYVKFDDIEEIIVSREIAEEKQVYLENYKANVPEIERMMGEWSALMSEQLAKEIDKEILNNLKDSFLPRMGCDVINQLGETSEYVVDDITHDIVDDKIVMNVRMRPVTNVMEVKFSINI
jgi:hypothetical protein